MKTHRLLSTLLTASFFHAAIALADTSGTNAPMRSCCASASFSDVKMPYADQSIYQVESTWTNDEQKPVKLGDLAGKPRVLLMFFSHCTTACPILINDLRRIETALPPEMRANIGFTLVSFDATRDTPAALAEYRKNWHLPSQNWTLLSGSPDDILELAALLGIKYKIEPDGQFAHSNVITVLNAKGEIVHQQIGLNADISETVKILRKLATPEPCSR